MTTTAPARTTAPLRALLLVDGVGTALLGAVALLAAEPLADEAGTPLALRAVGVLFLLVGAEMLLVRRADDLRLRAGARLLGAADLLFAAAVVGALALTDETGTGRALVLGVAAVCVGMGAAKLRLSAR